MPSGHLVINCLREIFCSIHVHLHTKLNPKRIQILTQASQVMPVIHRQQPIQASDLTIFKKGFVSGVFPIFFLFYSISTNQVALYRFQYLIYKGC